MVQVSLGQFKKDNKKINTRLIFIIDTWVFFIQLEQEERARIDAIKEEEHKKATEAIERWKETQKVQSNKEQEILKEEITELQKDNISTKKVDSSIEETQETQNTSEKRAVKKLQSHSKQQQPHGMVLYCPLSS